MKRVTLFALSCLAVVLTTQAQGIQPPPEGKAVVYFVRVSSLGAVIDFTYFDSTKVIGRFNSRNYIRYECDPGEHLFCAHSENDDFITADLEAGKIYFVEAVPSMGMLYAQVFLHPIDPSDKRMPKLENIVNKFSPRTMTDDELAREAKHQEKNIEQALEKYHKNLANGKKKYKRLERTMYYKP